MTSVSFHEFCTESGLQVLFEKCPGARSSGAGIFVVSGARDEDSSVAGISHFLEHMAFKATSKRKGHEMALALDEIGSKANAYTSWERTAFFARVLPECCQTVIALLGELIAPALQKEDFELERRVILEEIEMYMDRPDFLLFERVMEERFKDHPLGRKILGSSESVSRITVDQMKKWHETRYVDSNIVIAISGPFEFDDVRAWTDKFSINPGTAGRTLAEPPARSGHVKIERPEDYAVQYIHTWAGPIAADIDQRMIAGILEILLGDSEGSRLSWALSHPGIAEGVEAGSFSFQDAGLFFAGFSGRPDRYDQAVEILLKETRSLHSNLSIEELERAKTKFASRTVLASESPMGRMTNLANSHLDGLPYMTLKEELDLISSISLTEVSELAELLTQPGLSAAIGPVK